MHHIKADIRSLMGDSRLSNLALITVKREISKHVKYRIFTGLSLSKPALNLLSDFTNHSKPAVNLI